MNECPKCDGVHDHQLDWVKNLCPKCGGPMVAVMEPTKSPTVVKGPWLCEHANENPNVCPCANDCYCKRNTCAHKLVDLVAALKRGLAPVSASLFLMVEVIK